MNLFLLILLTFLEASCKKKLTEEIEPGDSPSPHFEILKTSNLADKIGKKITKRKKIYIISDKVHHDKITQNLGETSYHVQYKLVSAEEIEKNKDDILLVGDQLPQDSLRLSDTGTEQLIIAGGGSVLVIAGALLGYRAWTKKKNVIKTTANTPTLKRPDFISSETSDMNIRPRSTINTQVDPKYVPVHLVSPDRSLSEIPSRAYVIDSKGNVLQQVEDALFSNSGEVSVFVQKSKDLARLKSKSYKLTEIDAAQGLYLVRRSVYDDQAGVQLAMQAGNHQNSNIAALAGRFLQETENSSQTMARGGLSHRATYKVPSFRRAYLNDLADILKESKKGNSKALSQKVDRLHSTLDLMSIKYKFHNQGPIEPWLEELLRHQQMHFSIRRAIAGTEDLSYDEMLRIVHHLGVRFNWDMPAKFNPGPLKQSDVSKIISQSGGLERVKVDFHYFSDDLSVNELAFVAGFRKQAVSVSEIRNGPALLPSLRKVFYDPPSLPKELTSGEMKDISLKHHQNITTNPSKLLDDYSVAAQPFSGKGKGPAREAYLKSSKFQENKQTVTVFHSKKVSQTEAQRVMLEREPVNIEMNKSWSSKSGQLRVSRVNQYGIPDNGLDISDAPGPVGVYARSQDINGKNIGYFHAPGLAFDSKAQIHFRKYCNPDTRQIRPEKLVLVKEEYKDIAAMVVAAYKKHSTTGSVNSKRILVGAYGANNFVKALDPGSQRQVREAIADSLVDEFAGNALYFKQNGPVELRLGILGFVSPPKKKLLIEKLQKAGYDTTNIEKPWRVPRDSIEGDYNVNAWDPNSNVGNGNGIDHSMDGFVGNSSSATFDIHTSPNLTKPEFFVQVDPKG